MTTEGDLRDVQQALYRRQERREVQKALAAILTTSVLFCCIVLTLSNWIGHTPQVINVYVTHDRGG
jgi:hypothetical protein